MATIPEALAIALGHHQAGRLQAAEQIYRQILAVEPKQPGALHLLGVLAHQAGKHEAAIDLIERAIQANGTHPAFHCNLGEAYLALRKIPDAIACYQRAIQLKPDFPEAHNNLGNALQEQARYADAVACYQHAVQLKPDYAEAHNNLGNAFQNLRQLPEAVACYRRALQLKPGYAEAYSNLGNALKDQGQLAEALVCYRQALQLKPDFANAHSSLVYTLQFCPGYDPQTIYQENLRWNRQYGEPLAASIQPHPNERSPRRRLRIGYVSSYFCNHCQTFFTVPLFSAHEHENFEIFAYADVAFPDHITSRLRSCTDVWRNIANMTDGQVARLVREDRIDILVDLTMHMARNHLLLFARKPAPVQAAWLAYPGTTGLSAIDYRLTDPYIDPPGLFDRFYSEESIRLPDTFWCYDPLTTEPAVNALPAPERGHVTFGNLNNFCKVNHPVLKLWARVLHVVPGSKLLMLTSEGGHRQHTLDLLAQEGVAPDRVSFVGHQSRARYLELYHGLDIGLDTFPYNGHTTSLDSFWMGVPVITVVGQTVVGRAGLCQLKNLDLPELIADRPEQFVKIAADLAHDLPRLSRLRATLRERMERSPLMDAQRFARNVEAAYRIMWQRWCDRFTKR